LCADHSACARAVRGGARGQVALVGGAEHPAGEHQQHRGEPGVRPPGQPAPGTTDAPEPHVRSIVKTSNSGSSATLRSRTGRRFPPGGLISTRL
jgi:hypothetical protein